MGNATIRETELVAGALESIAAQLPASWAVDDVQWFPSLPGRGDALLELVAPDGDRVSFVVEAKPAGSLPIDPLLSTLRELKQVGRQRVLFVSDYLGPGLRAALADEGISYADATGWVRLISEDPLILLVAQGAERSPKRGRPTAVARLNGLAASRTIRALAAVRLPIGVRELASIADVSPGSVSKLLLTLTEEGIVDRDGRGGVGNVRYRALIRRWVRDYAFIKTNRMVGFYLAPRGLERLLSRLDDQAVPVVLTGSAAARRLLPARATSVVPLRLLPLYAASPAGMARDLGLIEADSVSANVVIATPQDPQILAGTDRVLSTAPVPLVLADLLTLPNRSDAEAEQLMDALARDDARWQE